MLISPTKEQNIGGMTKKSNLLIISLLITIGLFIYLTVHHFALKIGLGSNSICAINSKINCDAAATSSFAEIFGIPIALLGASFHFILLCFVLFYRMGFVESSAYLQKTIRGLLSLAFATSVVMAIVSAFVVKVLCPFCAGTYVFSIFNIFLGWNLVQLDAKHDFQLSEYFGTYKSHLIALACIPLLGWISSAMIQDSYGLDEIKKRIPEKIAIWKAGTQYSFDKNLGLTNKVENPRITLVEFADFKCPHCKVASDTIDAFLKGKSDIQFTYKPYPLDGTCNSGMQQKGDGSRCTLAAFTLCAEKLENKGWDMHHWIFARQDELFSVTDAKKLLPDIEKDLGLDANKMAECSDSTEIFEQIKKSADEGNASQVEGTPTIYMNGKKLPWGQFLEVLKEASAQAN